jgi:glycosyltransferase involved in cell wall biosynthesis
MATYKRAWILPYSLGSLANQSRCPDEVIVVLKPSNDSSKQILEKFSSKLPIKIVIQRRGFVVEAVQLGIESSSGDVILFIDDDAIAETDFVAKYEKFFDHFKNVGGATGLIFKAYLGGKHLVKTTEYFIPPNVARPTPYRKPLSVFKNYSGWVSKSGLSTTTVIQNSDVTFNALLCGANMGFVKRAIDGCPLNQLYRGSRKGFNYESVLAYWARIKGFHTCRLTNPATAPIVWHLVHQNHLTLRNNFEDNFWLSYDVFKNYFRYKKMGADVSFLRWIQASIVLLRKKPLIKILAFLYTILDTISNLA